MPYADPAEQRAYQRRWMRRRREEWFADKRCATCGTGQQLETDHVDPRLKKDHKVWSWTAERRNRELKKCQVLCKKCHAKKTAKEVEPPHGTHGRYVHHRCRCRPCKDAHALVNKKYR